MPSPTSPDLPSPEHGSRRRFELVRELGSGTFGTVYLADMASLGGFKKRVALKMLNPQWDDGSDAGRRLRDEARLLGRIRHRNIVSVDDLVRIDGRWGVVMEYVPGIDLERLITAAQDTDQTLPVTAALEICAAVADALHAAYAGTDSGDAALSVVHRDIKPSNILLTPSGEVKVLDFGIALARFDEREAQTARVRYGSIPYMAPERVLGEEETTAGDIYSLGCVLYELLKAERFGRAELGPDQHRLQRQIALDRLIDVPPPVHALLEECLHYDPQRRPSAANVASRAEQIARQIGHDHLRDYARRVIPPLQEQAALQTPSPPSLHVLSEELFPVPTSSRPPSAANPTLVFSDDAAPRDEEISLTLSPHPSSSSASPTLANDPHALTAAPRDTARRLSPLHLRLIGGLTLIVACFSVIAIGLPFLDTPTPAPVPAEPILIPSPPVPAPPQELAQPPADVVPPEIPAPPEISPPPPTQSTPPPQRPPSQATPREKPPKPPESPPVETVSVPPEGGSSGAAETIRAVKFTAPAGASNIRASCGGVSGSGTSSATLRNLSAGTCTITAEVEGATLQASVQVRAPGGFTCVADGGALKCQ